MYTFCIWLMWNVPPRKYVYIYIHVFTYINTYSVANMADFADFSAGRDEFYSVQSRKLLAKPKATGDEDESTTEDRSTFPLLFLQRPRIRAMYLMHTKLG